MPFTKVRDITADLLHQAGIKAPPVNPAQVATFLWLFIETRENYPALYGIEQDKEQMGVNR
jgi:hypothetical protein